MSGPITGVKNFEEVFQAAQDYLEKDGYEVVNPAQLHKVLNKSATYEEYMGIDLELLKMCDALVQLPGWEKSIGANRELGYALAADKIVLQIENFVEVSG